MRHEHVEPTHFVGLESEPCGGANNDLTVLMTRFLSLDKCLPKRQHMQVTTMTVDDDNDNSLHYNLEWLAILRKTHHLGSHHRTRAKLSPHPMVITEQNVDKVRTGLNHNTAILHNFVKTMPAHGEVDHNHTNWWNAGKMIGNPQTDTFLHAMGLAHTVTVPNVNYKAHHKNPKKAPCCDYQYGEPSPHSWVMQLLHSRGKHSNLRSFFVTSNLQPFSFTNKAHLFYLLEFNPSSTHLFVSFVNIVYF